MTVFMWNCKKRKRKKWGEIKRKEIFCRRPKREEIEENQEACC
jgi:hypothetical protein